MGASAFAADIEAAWKSSRGFFANFGKVVQIFVQNNVCAFVFAYCVYDEDFAISS